MPAPRKPSRVTRLVPGGTARKVLARAAVAAAVLLAAFLLYRTLSQYDPREIVDSVMAVPGVRLAAAAGFAAASYLCLTLFDFLGLRYAGHPLPWHRAAFASFVALSIGQNIGLAGLSTGAIRYRFYGRWGLGVPDVARVILFSGATVALGLAMLGGLVIVVRPQLAAEFLGLGRGAALALAAAALGLCAAYLAAAAFVRGKVGYRDWTVHVPPLRLAAAQLVVGPVNFALVAACLHQAMLGLADVAYVNTAAAYVIANVATLITHAPGGLGVIESVMLFFMDEARLIGALLVFRLVYFLGPLAIGALLFAAHELAVRGSLRPARQG